MAKIARITDFGGDKRKHEIENHHYFTMDQVKDVVALLNAGEYPDARFSDDECSLWSMLRRELQINF